MNIKGELFALQDKEYKEFHKKLIPTVDENRLIGVRIPQIRKLAKKVDLDTDVFTNDYYEEVMLYGIAIGNLKNNWYKYLDNFVSKIDNWAICDSVCSSLKFANKHQYEVWDYLNKFKFSNKEYEQRFAIIMMMDYFLNDEYIDEVIDYYKSIKSDYYYVNMAISWALATAYINYSNKVESLLKQKELSDFVNNKTIQKIRESYRISKEDKEKLNRYKR